MHAHAYTHKETKTHIHTMSPTHIDQIITVHKALCRGYLFINTIYIYNPQDILKKFVLTVAAAEAQISLF